ncbi:MAG: diaminopimelate epimerase [Pseudomonadota bacterium]
MGQTGAERLPFMKMHGLGNDFVVLDARAQAIDVTKTVAVALGDRRRGIGFDQLALIENGSDSYHLRFWNSDGTAAAACGNATRCIARYLMKETGKDQIHLTTARGDIYALDAGNGATSVNMGQPQLLWNEIPLAEEMDTLALPIQGNPVATGMGNPHCTFFVDDAEVEDLEEYGTKFEHHPLYPERTNVQIASLKAPEKLRVRVWERGVGVTLASGSSSCAVAVAAVRRGITDRQVSVELDGGVLEVDWREDGVWMTGPTTHVCDGEITVDFLEALK